MKPLPMTIMSLGTKKDSDSQIDSGSIKLMCKCANVQMCKCADVHIKMVFAFFHNLKTVKFNLHPAFAGKHLHICTSAHLHIINVSPRHTPPQWRPSHFH